MSSQRLRVLLVMTLAWATFPASAESEPQAPAEAAAPAATAEPVPGPVAVGPTQVMPTAPGAAPRTAEPPLGFDADDLPRLQADTAEGVSSAWAIMVKTTVALFAVLLLAYLLLGKGLGGFVARQGLGRSLRVVDRVGLDARKTLFLVEVDGMRALVGTTENAISMLVLPDDGTRPPASASAPGARDSDDAATPATNPGGSDA